MKLDSFKFRCNCVLKLEQFRAEVVSVFNLFGFSHGLKAEICVEYDYALYDYQIMVRAVTHFVMSQIDFRH